MNIGLSAQVQKNHVFLQTLTYCIAILNQVSHRRALRRLSGITNDVRTQSPNTGVPCMKFSQQLELQTRRLSFGALGLDLQTPWALERP